MGVKKIAHVEIGPIGVAERDHRVEVGQCRASVEGRFDLEVGQNGRLARTLGKRVAQALRIFLHLEPKSRLERRVNCFARGMSSVPTET